MMDKKTCFFLGHADASSDIYPKLLSSIERHITQYGVTEFFVGNHGAFDRLSLHALKEAQSSHPHIRLIHVQPYHPGMNPSVPEGFDESFYPFDIPVHPRFAISKANKRMIETCDFLIAYVWHSGRSRAFFEYAQKYAAKGALYIDSLK